MIDTHCHLYSKDFVNDFDDMLKKAQLAGVSGFYMPAIDSTTHADMLEIGKKYPQCLPMIGLHPCSVNEGYQSEIDQVIDLLKTEKFIAIGETGLDFYWDKTFMKQQYEALHIQAELALQYALPLVLHTRNAMQETIDEIGKYVGRGLKGVFHCFGGSLSEARQIIDMGFYLGIGGVVTFKNSDLGEVLKEIDLQSILLETDAPYLAPVPYRGKRNEPGYLPLIAEKIAAMKQCSIEVVQQMTTDNAKRLFEMHG